jgi:hypothetical protein
MTYQPQPVPAKTQGFSVTALVTGVVGLVFCWVPGLNLTLGVVATVFGALAVRNERRGLTGGKGMAIAGLVTGIITVVIAGTLLIVAATAVGGAAGY